jgi:hypothetical protein
MSVASWALLVALATCVSGCAQPYVLPEGAEDVRLIEASVESDAVLEARCELLGVLGPSAEDIRVRALRSGANVVQARRVGTEKWGSTSFVRVGGRAWRCSRDSVHAVEALASPRAVREE